MTTEKKERFIAIDEVINRTGLSRTVIYERMKDNTFPRSVRLGKQTTRWLESEIDSLIDQQSTNNRIKF
ncbi:AlpA family phage regulatory protein [Pasteurella skyensis]|uniref:AlpA family phage regulatory protein n=1 Tax=Phocoenobacter skyensis TaxID=97481 RepID=A0AAJ6ND42_9PAST|nr:AlpA family phage regulatory protein [Pasteurella skyensis]MDP8170551.1 AlpA family phage regulatory protein [Pasteurella skyensis]MDP8174622.1 AlpA family phage regulatory protein [Pasteurella skyensis]